MSESSVIGELDSRPVLVVDYHEEDRRTLVTLLIQLGYEVVEASTGTGALESFQQHRPWLVITEVFLPELDGFEAVRQIKQAADGVFVPVLFVTRSRDEAMYERCVDAGGDDFLQGPLTSLAVLRAKLSAMKRIVRLYHEVHGLHQVLQREEEVAEALLSGAIEGGNKALDQVRIYKRPASTFCGDVHLTAFRPDGDLNVLLGDFTGHGLTSVIGALPLSETFRAMTRKGYSGQELLQQINQKLKSLLPAGMFLACSLVRISTAEGRAYIWNCGMPSVLVMSSETSALKCEVTSADPPLGIMADMKFSPAQVISLNPDDRILLISDGLPEARSPDGEMFGEERLLSAACDGMAVRNLADRVMFAVNCFMNGRLQDDDVSLIEIPANVRPPASASASATAPAVAEPAELAVPGAEAKSERQPLRGSGWRWNIMLRGVELRHTNPVPMLLSQMQEMEGQGEHWQTVFTVLTELYINALDHGVLQIDSDLKSSPEGFAQYYAIREQRLNELTEGSVEILLEYKPNIVDGVRTGGCLDICVQDSGNGFEVSDWLCESRNDVDADDTPQLCGRGIRLAQQLTETLCYSDGGRRVDAHFCW